MTKDYAWAGSTAPRWRKITTRRDVAADRLALSRGLGQGERVRARGRAGDTKCVIAGLTTDPANADGGV